MGEKNRTVALSRRMQMLADMVTAGSSVADVGCDHAFLSIYLVQTGKCPKCLAMDVREGPLSGAGEHIASYGLGEYIEARLSDGLSAYHIGEAQTLVCAGMGGRLMGKILREGGEKSRSFSGLVLQPQSEIPEFRRFLRKAGYRITEEDAVYEEGRYYFAMKAVYMGQEPFAVQGQSAEEGMSAGQGQRQLAGQGMPPEELYDLYGRQLLLGQHPVLKQFLLRRMETVEGILARLQQADTIKGEARQRELYLEKEQLERALNFFKEGR